jgi:hypothetical protein
MENFANENKNKGVGLGQEEFVLTRTNNGDGEPQFVGGGYKVNSFFLQGDKPIMTTYNNSSSDQSGGKVSSPFENLAVPAGLFFINQRIPKNYLDEDITTDKKYNAYTKHETVSDDMIDKLFGLVDADKKRKRKTKKHIEKSNKKKTRKA